jgi:hypothetical protein
MTENEWNKAINLRQRYWLYVVTDCATDSTRLHRIQDPIHIITKSSSFFQLHHTLPLKEILAFAEGN